MNILDRSAVKRVLRRAVELEGADGRRVPDVDAIDSETLVLAAVEAGIPEIAVRRALAIERLGPPPERDHGVLGAPVVVVDEELAGGADEVLARLDAWLVSGHHLRRDRLRDGRGSWTRRRGVVASAFRSLRHATGEGQLGDLERIDAVVVDSGANTCVVRVAADRRRERRARNVTGAAVATVTMAGAVASALVLGPVFLLAAPVSVAAGAGIAAGGRRRAQQVAGEIERVLDSVEHGSGPSRLAPDLARRVMGGRGTTSPAAQGHGTARGTG